MDYELSRKIDGDAGTKQRIEVIRTMARNHKYAEDENAEETEQKCDADESPLLGICSENKIRLIFW